MNHAAGTADASWITTRDGLAADLVRLGLVSGDIVMVHASVRAVGPVIGGPDQIHGAITDAIGPSGTMMMYVGCQAGFDDIGRGVLTADQEAQVRAAQPAFDPQSARAARDFGVLAEFFRSAPGTICSDHVCARMAARGARADWLLADQPWNYGFGIGSPLHKLCEAGGKVLLLGSDPEEVTLMHHAEHVARFAPKRIARYEAPVLEKGIRVWKRCDDVDTADYPHPSFPDRAYAAIVDSFIRSEAGSGRRSAGDVGNAACHLFDARALVTHAVAMMEGWSRG
jgi:aminoglycoside 3-N-acetyltransferase